jgi:hypothetical protein
MSLGQTGVGDAAGTSAFVVLEKAYPGISKEGCEGKIGPFVFLKLI